MPYFYLKIDPVLSDNEILFFTELEKLSAVYKEVKSKNSLSDFQPQLINFADKFSIQNTNFLQCALDFPNLDILSALTHTYGCKYRVEYSATTMCSQIFKLIHVFHTNGLLKKLLSLSFESHNFNGIVVDERINEDRGLIIEDLLIFDAAANDIGLFEKGNLHIWLMNNPETKIIQKYVHYKELTMQLPAKTKIAERTKI